MVAYYTDKTTIDDKMIKLLNQSNNVVCFVANPINNTDADFPVLFDANLYGFQGTVIIDDPHLLNVLLRIPNITIVFYDDSLYWTTKKPLLLDEMEKIYHNKKVRLATSSEKNKKIIEDVWNINCGILSEDLNVTII